jgi:outer membrane protein assembly factor BamE (lipoprotein component of BamABCDE complex)
MKFPMLTRSSHAFFATITTVALLTATACNTGRRFTKANVDEVAIGMPKKQVESILGQPDSVSNIVARKTIYVYQQGDEKVTITFKDDEVQAKDSTVTK